MQFLNYADGSVRVYHTRIEHERTPLFECGGLVALTDIRPADDAPTIAIVMCPTGCGAGASVPLTGDPAAQRLHAHVRLANPKHPAKTLVDAIESVLGDVAERGGVSSIGLALEALELIKGKPDRKSQPILAAIKVEREELRDLELARMALMERASSR